MRKVFLTLVVAGAIIFPLGVRAVETTTPIRKTAAEIEAYKAQMRLQKAPLIEAEKARLRALKAGLVTEYKTNLQTLKDQTKAVVVDRLNNRICNLNKNVTTNMTNNLTKMSAILDRVDLIAASESAAGKDITVVQTAVASARSAISRAQTAVNTQADMECVLTISGSDTTVGSEVRNQISGLEAKLNTVKLQVQSAREAVAKAIMALARIRGEQITTSIKEGV